jgi:hypothetical protein
MTHTTLTILAIVALLSIIIGTRPDKRVSGKTRAMRQHVARITGKPTAADSLPRCARNHWDRRDLSRMLMTEDEHLGQITNPR